jgi:DNA modification methylase
LTIFHFGERQAENLGRRCFAMEIDAGFTAVALERLSDMRVTPKLISH